MFYGFANASAEAIQKSLTAILKPEELRLAGAWQEIYLLKGQKEFSQNQKENALLMVATKIQKKEPKAFAGSIMQG